MKNSMKTAQIHGMEKKSLNELTRTERIRLYMNDHPEVLTEKLMTYVAAFFLNYGYIRLRIKQMYPKIIYENMMNNNFVRIPDHYNEQEQE